MRHFRLAADAARRKGDVNQIVVALRNVADEQRRQGDLVGAERSLAEMLAIPATTETLELDIAKTKLIFAAVRAQQRGRDDAIRFLDEAQAAFRRRVDGLDGSDSLRLRRHRDDQLRSVESLREAAIGRQADLRLSEARPASLRTP